MASSSAFTRVDSRIGSAKGAPADRIHALDALRAVAMFLGILLHAAMPYTITPFPGGGNDISRNVIFDVMILLIHGFRMHLFFFLAGFFGRLLHERLGTKEFLKQRWKRIGLPFVLSMLTIMPMTVFLALWGYARQGQPMPEMPGDASGIPTMHLWFLLYLLYLYAAAVVIAKLPRPKIFDSFLDAIFSSPLRLFVFAFISAPFLWNGPWWGEPMPGIFGLLPVPATLAYYGTFFLGGWYLHARSHNLPRLKEFTLPTLTIALIAQAIYGGVSHLKFWPIENLFLLKCIVLFASATYAWGMTFATIGLFLRFCSKASARGRYLADASYWCYLAHMPIIMFLQVISASWRWPASLKFTLILAITLPILLALYEWRVRYTWVGNMLNGPRKKPEFGCSVPSNQETSPAS